MEAAWFELYATLNAFQFHLYVQHHVFNLMKDLEEAHKAVAEGNALEPVLRQKIADLEDEKEDLMVQQVFCLQCMVS